MMTKQHKNPLTIILKKNVTSLPTPMNMSFMWNLGFMLFVTLMMQIITGIILASYYSPDLNTSFSNLFLMTEFTSFNWLTRNIHANGASLFFFLLYLHTARNIYYHSFLLTHTWMIGITLLILVMATAFMGYVLPCNQMSFWGASVITNLFSEVPYIGKNLVTLIWGGPSVMNPTILRFFAFHFTLPFMIMGLAIIHLNYLHMTGSNNILALPSKMKIPFDLPSLIKDMLMFIMIMMMFMLIVMYFPLMLSDNENFVEANPLQTPHHIQPEWYFLFAYAILRSIPNKLGGVIALLFSIMILYTLPFSTNYITNSTAFYPLTKILFWSFIFNIIFLTWMGACSVEEPYIFLSQVSTSLYFLFFMTFPLISFNN